MKVQQQYESDDQSTIYSSSDDEQDLPSFPPMVFPKIDTTSDFQVLSEKIVEAQQNCRCSKPSCLNMNAVLTRPVLRRSVARYYRQHQQKMHCVECGDTVVRTIVY